MFNNLCETAANNLFATIYKNPNSKIVNSSLIIMVFTTLGEIIGTIILSYFGGSIETSWNLYIGGLMAFILYLIFCFMHKYARYSVSFS